MVAISRTFVEHDRFSDSVRGGSRHLLNKKRNEKMRAKALKEEYRRLASDVGT
jgi:hypothetical protein